MEPCEIFLKIFYTTYLGWNVENPPTRLSRIIYLNNVTSIWWNGVNLINSSVASPGNMAISEGVHTRLMRAQQRILGRVSATIQRTSHHPREFCRFSEENWNSRSHSDGRIDIERASRTRISFLLLKENTMERNKVIRPMFWIKSNIERFFLKIN